MLKSEIVVYEDNGVDANGMDYSKITPLLLEAIKALKADNERLKSEIDQIKTDYNARLKKLENRLERTYGK